MQDNEAQVGGVPTRVMEIVVAGTLMAVGAVVIYDSLRLGAGWTSMGPGSGFFPFYIGLLLFLASAGTLVVNLLVRSASTGYFVDWTRFSRVLQVFVPTAIFIGATPFIGIYVSAAIFIAYFMTVNGRYPVRLTLPISLGVPLVFFFMFERWFLVPLPKGPLERLIGL
ncbi:MAG TPA: tripartite tricarboxylate transporter TctB family protein [Beijerinckiaceae bacterium]|nr:tripartite tricarboxylate transporter TctB family protein [Beijerinckiaceae bacterium]